jgi:hypothetical protein
MFLRIEVHVPEKLSRRERALYEELRHSGKPDKAGRQTTGER